MVARSSALIFFLLLAAAIVAAAKDDSSARKRNNNNNSSSSSNNNNNNTNTDVTKSSISPPPLLLPLLQQQHKDEDVTNYRAPPSSTAQQPMPKKEEAILRLGDTKSAAVTSTLKPVEPIVRITAKNATRKNGKEKIIAPSTYAGYSPLIPSESFDQDKQEAEALLNVNPQTMRWSNSEFNNLGPVMFENGQEDRDPILSNSTIMVQPLPTILPRTPNIQESFDRYPYDSNDGQQPNWLDSLSNNPTSHWLGDNSMRFSKPNQRQSKPDEGERKVHLSMYNDNEPTRFNPHTMGSADNYNNNNDPFQPYDPSTSQEKQSTKFHAVGYVMPMPMPHHHHHHHHPSLALQSHALSPFNAHPANPQPQYNQFFKNDKGFPYYQQEQFDPYLNDDKLTTKPDTVINVHPVSYQSLFHDMATKPKTVVLVTSHDVADPTRKFYHPFYPGSYFDQAHAAVSSPEFYVPHEIYPFQLEPQNRSISPWKKILHLIGAFLPLGLLLAFLTPKVPHNQNNDPNIILSKLRVNDLPAEHKNHRLLLDNATEGCEERSICRLVAAVDPPRAIFLRQLMQRVTERAPESAVRKKELDRIFEAAKLGNCDILTCNFYDGT